MEAEKYQQLLAKLRVARNDAQRVDGLRNYSDEWQESVASSLDKLADIVAAVLAEVGPTKHAQAVNEIMPPAPRMSLGEIAKNPDARD
jgi:hypothetical protein